jgi:hypothetical protein
MRRTSVFIAATGLIGVLVSNHPPARAAIHQPDTAAQKTALLAPESIRTEHEAIHGALVEATRAPGAVGAAAKELATVLHPHFVREEEIALPPLGLLGPLAAGRTPAGMDEALVMSDTLRKEMPRMLEEHTAIRAAVDKLLQVARQEKAEQAIGVAEALALHAKTEEEVLYPAAILVGDVIRARTTR